jgi:hypothetical protein
LESKKKLERALSKEMVGSSGGGGGGDWPKSDRDTGYVSRDKSRSRDDFLAGGGESSSPQESLLNSNSSSKRLESYLMRQARGADDFDVLADQQEIGGGSSKQQQSTKPTKLVKRQASKCSSLATAGGGGPGSGVPGQYRRNMEAVGEFERVWGLDNEAESAAKKKPDGKKVGAVPLTRELSPEFKRPKSPIRSGRNSRATAHMSPVEAAANNRRQQHQQQQRGRSPPDAARNPRASRGISSPAEFRRALSPAMVPRASRQGPLPPPPLSQLPHRAGAPPPRRALSPDLRRSSSRVGAISPDPVRVLRREKTTLFDNRTSAYDNRTSLFDNRYPSLDVRTADKRKSMAAAYADAEMMFQEGGMRSDLRRRSYHELHYPPQMGPPLEHFIHPQFMPGGPAPPHNFQHTGKKKDKAPKPPDYSRYPGLDRSTPNSGGVRSGGERMGGHPPQHVLPAGIHPPAPTQWLGGPSPPGHGPPGGVGDPRGGYFHHPMMGPHPGGPPPPPPPQGRFRGAPMRHY